MRRGCTGVGIFARRQSLREDAERAVADGGACDQVEAWLESPSLTVFGEEPGHWAALREVLETSRVAGPRIHAGRIAALCVRHGVTVLLTTDRDFTRFSGLRTCNPLVTQRQR